MNKKLNLTGNIIALVILIFAIAMGFSIHLMFNEMKNQLFKTSGEVVYTKAKVTNIEVVDNPDGSYSTEVTVDIEINGIEDTRKFDTLREDLTVGDEIEVHYEKNNPYEISDGSAENLVNNVFSIFDISYILYFFGGLGIIIDCYFIYKKIYNHKHMIHEM